MTEKREALFSVSHIEFFNNELRSTFVIADFNANLLDVLRTGLTAMAVPPTEEELSDPEYDPAIFDPFAGFEDCVTLEDAKQAAFNMDAMVNVELFRKSKATKMP